LAFSRKNCRPLHSFAIITATTIFIINGLQLFNGRPLAIIAVVVVSFSFHRCHHPFPLSLNSNAPPTSTS
jgi:hypothetical protein